MPTHVRALLVSLVLLCSALVGTTPATATAPASPAASVAADTVTGIVTRPDGTPAAGFDVALAGPMLQDYRTTVTSATGRYTFAGVAPGNWQLLINSDDYQWEALPLTLDGTTGVTRDIRLVPLLAIIGRVTVPRGASAAGVHVIVHPEIGSGGWDTFTDSQGDYRIGGLRRGRYIISFYGEEIPTQLRYWPNATGLDTAGVLTVQDTDLTGVDQTLLRAGFITGRVTVPDGRPVPDFPVLGSSSQGGYSRGVVTDDNGRYRLPAHQPDLAVELGWGGLQNYVGLSSVDYPGRLTVASGAERTGIDATVEILHSLTTGIVTGTGGARLAGISVQSCNQYGRCEDTVTDAHGRYWLYQTFGDYTYDIRFSDTDGDGTRYFSGELAPLSPGARQFIDHADIALVEDTSLPPLEPLTPPTISGTAQVGATLTASNGTWSPTPTTYRYQWLDGGSPIAGATARMFVPTAAQLGDDVSVRVTAVRAGYENGQSESSTVYITPDPSSVPHNVTRPTISGASRVGSTLTVAPGTWAPSDVTLSYQWLRDGRRVSGQTSTRYVPVPGDLGKVIACQVMAQNDIDSATERVEASSVVAPGLITAPRPTISGKVKVGKKLLARPGTARPGTAHPTYRWKRGSAFISGANAATYVLQRADRRKRITLVVTWAQRSYTTVTVSSAATKKVT